MSSSKKKKENKSEATSSAEDHSLQERLDRELAWCVEQLKLGIRSKPSNDKQVTEAVRLLRILESASTPEPKKRLLMKATFGDYRKKMVDELKQIDAKSKTDMKKIRVEPVSSTVQCKSTFYRKSISSAVQSSDVSCATGAAANFCLIHSDQQQQPTSCLSSFSFDFDSESHNDRTEPVRSLINADLPSLSSSFQAFSTTGSEFRFCFDETTND